MKWTCPECKDVVDIKFKRSHERICKIIEDKEREEVEKFLRSLKGEDNG